MKKFEKILQIIGACILILFVILWGLHALNSTPEADNGGWSGVDFSYYKDKTAQLNISQVNSIFTQGDFIEKETPNFNFGRSHAAFWIRVFVSDTDNLRNYIAVYCPNVQDVRLYIPTEEGYKTYASGWGNSAIRKDEGLTYPVFRLDWEQITGQAVYLRIQSDYSHLYTINLYDETELQHAKLVDYSFNSFLFGILLTIVMINFIIYLVLRSNICLLFALCVLLISAHQGCTTGIYNVLLTRHSDVIMQFSIEIGALYFILLIVFFMVLSEVKTRHRVYYRCCQVLIAAYLLIYPLCMIDKVTANLYGHTLCIIPPLFIMYASLRLYFMGKIRYRLLLFGWCFTTINYIIVSLSAEGILHLQNDYIRVHGTLMAFVIVSALFTIATVNYTKTIQMKHLKMQRQVQFASERVKWTETALLQTKIKPHFLYNTLTAIEQLCATDSRKAQMAISDFSGFLRSNIDFSAETQLIRIERELTNVKHYLSLEQMRFEERLKVVYDIQAAGFLVPPLVVQSIVENAVRHGVTKRPEGGTITISIHDTQTDHVITVTDNGVGFDPDSNICNGRYHIGIDNAHERLHRQCGGTLKIDSKIGIGTVVTMSIPKGGNV